MNDRIMRAKELAMQQNWNMRIEDCVFFFHHGVPILNPWGGNSEQRELNPYVYYGEEKIDEFIARIIAKHDTAQEEKVFMLRDKVMQFLVCTYYGDFKDPYLTASKHAYMELDRSIRYGSVNRIGVIHEINCMLEDAIDALQHIPPADADTYTNWHYQMCIDIIKVFEKYCVSFNVGQSQSWVNVMMMNLCILQPEKMTDLYPFLHIPLDDYIIGIAERQYGVAPLKIPWNRIQEYETYMEYEKTLMSVINQIPLEWEFDKYMKKILQETRKV